MGLAPAAGVDVYRLADHLKVEVCSADQLVPRMQLEQLEKIQPGAFSAATFHLPDGRTVAVFNPCSPRPRTHSDLAHELAHVLLGHIVRELQRIGGHAFLTCDPEQEQEANWLAGCLLLPRALLLKEARNGADGDTLAEKYGVTPSMARFRLNTSGVLLQLQRTRKS